MMVSSFDVVTAIGSTMSALPSGASASHARRTPRPRVAHVVQAVEERDLS